MQTMSYKEACHRDNAVQQILCVCCRRLTSSAQHAARKSRPRRWHTSTLRPLLLRMPLRRAQPKHSRSANCLLRAPSVSRCVISHAHIFPHFPLGVRQINRTLSQRERITLGLPWEFIGGVGLFYRVSFQHWDFFIPKDFRVGFGLFFIGSSQDSSDSESFWEQCQRYNIGASVS